MSTPESPATTPAFDPRAARQIHDWAHTSRLLVCRVDPTGKYVFAGANDHTIQRWEIATGTQTPLTGHENWVRTLHFSPDGATLYSGGYDGRWIAWEAAAANPKPVRTVPAHTGWLRGLAVSKDGKRIATCGNDKLVKIWSTEDGQLIREMAGHPNMVYCVQFCPASNELVSGDIVANIFHWRADDGGLIRRLESPEVVSIIGDVAPFGGIINLAFSPDGQKLTATGLYKVSNAPAGNRRAMALSFDWKTGEKLGKQESLKKELDGTMWRALYHPSGPLIGVFEKEIGFWNAGEEDAFHMVTTPSDIFDCDLHPNQLDIFTAHHDGHVRGTRLAAG